MEQWKGKVAVVTGASAGIGAAIAERLVEAGLKVVGIARRAELVEETAMKLQGKDGHLFAFQADVTKENDILQAFKWIKDNLGPVHILVNNAGVIRTTSLLEGDKKLWKDIMDINVLGLCTVTREAIKDMRENNVNGHIIHMNSISGHVVGRGRNLGMYSASKHAVTAATKSWREELNSIGSKIKITSISPGLVATDIFANGDLASGLREPLKRRQEILNSSPKLQPCHVADAVIYALGTPPNVQVEELIIRSVGEKF